MTPPIRVLLVNDEPDPADMTSLFLQRERELFETHAETRPTSALSRLDSERCDCVVSDYDMPEMNGLELRRSGTIASRRFNPSRSWQVGRGRDAHRGGPQRRDPERASRIARARRTTHEPLLRGCV
ncbi:response regulator [Haladaptatus sp. DFWS20]|uniref:response regulator n=1 Tax=Haladaptatus sp. DFWS20 TaxID=3403467 RepID=UPI003EBC0D59